MGRPLRRHLPSSYVRVTQECHNASALLSEGSDRTLYLDLLAGCLALLNYHLVNFYIRETGIELLLLTSPTIEGHSLSAFMHRLNTAFSRRYNRLHQRSGSFWNRRFNDHWLTPEETARLAEEIAATGERHSVPVEIWPWCGEYWVQNGRECPWPLALITELYNCLNEDAVEPKNLLQKLRQVSSFRRKTSPCCISNWEQRQALLLKKAAAEGRIPRSLPWNTIVECHARILLG